MQEQRPGSQRWRSVLAADEAAEMLGVSEQTVRRWLRQGWVRGQQSGARWLLDRDQLLADAAAISDRRRNRRR